MYFMIRNPGLADLNAITLLGASTSRYSNAAIGTFGSGSKYTIALLLRHGISPVYTVGNLKMDFETESLDIGGYANKQILIKYSGKDSQGRSINRTDKTSMTTAWGVSDWTKLEMAMREIVANAIDGAIASGKTYADVEMNIVESPRAKADHTAVFIPLGNHDLNAAIASIQETFLHFKRPDDLQRKFIAKVSPDNLRVYKNGVLVNVSKKKSLFDYNLGNELTLDESRNASDWDVKNAIARAIAKTDSKTISQVLTAVHKEPDLLEASLDKWTISSYAEQNKPAWLAGARLAFGDRGIVTSSKGPILEIISRKGFEAISLGENFAKLLESVGYPSDKSILNGLELSGLNEVAPSPDMIKALDEVWNLFVAYDLTNKKTKPPLKAFSPIMNAESQVFGMYKAGTVYIHTDMGIGRSPMLLQTMLEEVVHHITGSGDSTRDFQDFLMRVIVKVAF